MSRPFDTKAPIPSLEWYITHRCNYRCPYCCQGDRSGNRHHNLHSSDETVDAFIKFLAKLKGSWCVKLCGGEIFVHRRFFEVCEKIFEYGHTLFITTNFSYPLKAFQKLVDLGGDKLVFVDACYHATEVKSPEAFVDKAAAFRSIKHPETGFQITAVLIEELFEHLKEVEKCLNEKGVDFKYNRLILGGKYVDYPQHIEDHLTTRNAGTPDKVKGKNFNGVLCHTGHIFFLISYKGDVRRCHTGQDNSYLGNITDGTFKPFEKPEPCQATKCICPVAINRNLILIETE